MSDNDPFGENFVISDEFYGDTFDPAAVDEEGYRCGV